jgi:hypothetical protein
LKLRVEKGGKMLIDRFDLIKKRLNLRDDVLYFYAEEADGTVKLRPVNEYELLAEEGLREVYDSEPDGLWEQCLED